jgi:putative transposon-encoded protein
MKYFDWNEEKNVLLKREREIGFEDVVTAIGDKRLLAVVDHPNQKKYQNQKIYVVEISCYAYHVPFVEDEEKVFLKTIIPSRKATEQFLIKRKRK